MFKGISCQKTHSSFFLQGFNLKILNFAGICDLESIVFVHPVESWRTTNAKKCSLACSVIQTDIFYPYLLHFSVKISIEIFYLKRSFRFWISTTLSSTSEIESWLTKIDKVLLVLRYLDFLTCFSQQRHIWIFNQRLNWRRYVFKCLSDKIISGFVP